MNLMSEKAYKAAVVIIPPSELWPPIQAIGKGRIESESMTHIQFQSDLQTMGILQIAAHAEVQFRSALAPYAQWHWMAEGDNA